jgi:hypothetical protein
VVEKQLADLFSDALQNVHSAARSVVSGGSGRGRKPSRGSWVELVKFPIVSADFQVYSTRVLRGRV